MTTKRRIYALFIKDVLLLKDFGILCPSDIYIYIFAFFLGLLGCYKSGTSIIVLTFYYCKLLLFEHHTMGKPQQKQFRKTN